MPGTGYFMGLQGIEKTAFLGTAVRTLGSKAMGFGKGALGGIKATAGKMNAATGGKLAVAGAVGGKAMDAASLYGNYQSLSGTLRSGSSAPRAFGSVV